MEREVVRLERLGAQLSIVAVRQPRQGKTGSAFEPRGARPADFSITAAPVTQVLRAHARALLRRPAAFIRTLAFAIRLGHGRPRQTVAALLYFAEAVVAGDWLLARGVSHVHAHFSSTVALLVSRIWPIAFSMTVHGPDEFDAQPADLLRAKVSASRFVVAISHFARSQIMRRTAPADWHRIEVVPLGVDVSALVPAPREETAAFHLVCAGRLAPVKGHRVLIEALERLQASQTIDRPVVLHLAGAGPEQPALGQMVERAGLGSSVVFEGLLDAEALLTLYRGADLFVLPTFAEGVPVVLMEAMALELPCVSTWVSGVPELIEHGRSGVLVPPGDAGAMADAIAALLRDADARRALGRQGRAAVLARYDIDRNVRRLFEVFARHVGSPADTPQGAVVTIAPTATRAI